MKHINKLLLLFFVAILLVGIIISITILNTQPEYKELEHFYCGNAIYQSESVHKAGEQLFKDNCKSCHKIHEESVGPALYRVTENRPKNGSMPLFKILRI